MVTVHSLSLPTWLNLYLSNPLLQNRYSHRALLLSDLLPNTHIFPKTSAPVFIPNDIRRIVCKHIDRPQSKMLFQHPNVIIDHFLCLSFDSDHQTRRIEQFRHLLRCCKSCVFIQILLAKFIVKRTPPLF